MTSHTTHSLSFNIGEVGVSLAVDRSLSEDELTRIKHVTLAVAGRCRSVRMSNEQCAVAVLEKILATVNAFEAVDVGEITAKVGETAVSRELGTPADRIRAREEAERDWREFEFHCHVVARDGWVIVELAGELDVLHAAEVRQILEGLDLAQRAGLALDLRGLSFIDSTGVRLVLLAMQHAERHGADFALIRGPHAVHRALEFVGLADRLRIVPDPDMLHRGAPHRPH